MIINFNEIHKLAVEARKEEDNIDRLIKANDIDILEKPMGTRSGSCKGFCVIVSRCAVMGINSDCSSRVQQAVKLHETGHFYVPSTTKGIRRYHDFDVYGNYETDRDEMCANIWSAEYQLPDEEVEPMLNGDYGFFEAARRLGVSPEVLDFKFRSMKARGYSVNCPIYTNRSFMKKLL